MNNTIGNDDDADDDADDDDDDDDDDDVLSGMYGYQHLLLRDRYHDILQ